MSHSISGIPLRLLLARARPDRQARCPGALFVPDPPATQEQTYGGHYHAVVWIDHHEARIFHFNIEEIDRLVLRPHDPTRHIHHKAGSVGSGHAPEDQEFFREVAASIADAGAVLITGPASAKTELMKHIQADAPDLAKIIAGVETVDHPTDNELVAHARRYFKASDRMYPQRQ